MSLLQKRMESHNIAAAAEDGAAARDALQDDCATSARLCTMREETKASCDALCALGLDYIRWNLTSRGPAQRQLTLRHVSKAYAVSKSVDEKTVDWIFKMHYVDFDSLKRAAETGDDSICQIGASRVAYETIEAYIRGTGPTGEQTATNVRAAADWCVAKLNAVPVS